MARDAGSLVVGGRTLRVTSPGRVVYPEAGVTKAEVIGYSVRVADRMLPHLRRRPVTRIRWPQGVDGLRFFEKQLPRGAPEWVDTLTLEHSDGLVTYPVANESATLAWFAQQNALELHVPQWRWHGASPRVDRLVLDLDPGAGVGLAGCAQMALWLKERLDEADLVSVPVTSGSKGIHVYARWRSSGHPTSPSEYAKELAESAAATFPDGATASMARSDRAGKVFIDWSQNNQSKTTISPYSLRGRARPYVAAPRTWDELSGDALRQLLMGEVLDRLDDPDPLAVLLPA